ncbi:MAG: tRNA epoxyqueuosine(34) reductase QueG [Planctomycetaceae bacterium]
MQHTVSIALMNDAELSSAIKSEARRLGFELSGIAPAVSPDGLSAFHEWLNRGYDGEMTYIGGREAAYAHPSGVLESVRSIVMLAINYRTADTPASEPGSARVSRYAWGSVDYHDLIRKKLQQLADVMHQQRPGCRTRCVVDTAPLLERDFARLAGLGWFGKNTMLINKRAGSWLFLAALLTDQTLQYDEPHETSHCGTCTRCLDACPTDAFPEPYVLDARRCISYLTIELRGPIPAELRPGMGDWLFGCDICQDVCPWNNKAPRSDEPAFDPVPDLYPADAIALLGLSDDEFRERFRHTPLWRPKRAGLLRNAAIVLGNSGDTRALPALTLRLDDKEPLIRGAAAWAIGRLGGPQEAACMRARLEHEEIAHVAAELSAAIRAIEAKSNQ